MSFSQLEDEPFIRGWKVAYLNHHNGLVINPYSKKTSWRMIVPNLSRSRVVSASPMAAIKIQGDNCLLCLRLATAMASRFAGNPKATGAIKM